MKEVDEIKTEAKSLKVPIVFDDTASFLTEFIKSKKPKSVLEIGTGTGYSACIMLKASNEINLTSIEIDKERHALAKINLKNFKNKKKLILGDAGKVITKIKRKFDLIFLDGPKGQYGNYFKSLVKLLNKNGAIIADNIYFHGIAIGVKPCTKGMRSMIKGLHDFVVLANLSNLKVEEFDCGDGILVLTNVEG